MTRALLVIALAAAPLLPPSLLHGQGEGGIALVWVGGGVLLGSAIVDIVRAPGSAESPGPAGLALVQRPHGERGDGGLDLVYRPAWELRRDGRQEAPVPRSPGTALALSGLATFGTTAVGLGLATAGGWNDNHGTLLAGSAIGVVGMVVGPAVGHWYAGRADRAKTGLVVRILAVGLSAVGALIIGANLED